MKKFIACLAFIFLIACARPTTSPVDFLPVLNATKIHDMPNVSHVSDAVMTKQTFLGPVDIPLYNDSVEVVWPARPFCGNCQLNDEVGVTLTSEFNGTRYPVFVLFQPAGSGCSDTLLKTKSYRQGSTLLIYVLGEEYEPRNRGGVTCAALIDAVAKIPIPQGTNRIAVRLQNKERWFAVGLQNRTATVVPIELVNPKFANRLRDTPGALSVFLYPDDVAMLKAHTLRCLERENGVCFRFIDEGGNYTTALREYALAHDWQSIDAKYGLEQPGTPVLIYVAIPGPIPHRNNSYEYNPPDIGSETKFVLEPLFDTASDY